MNEYKTNYKDVTITIETNGDLTPMFEVMNLIKDFLEKQRPKDDMRERYTELSKEISRRMYNGLDATELQKEAHELFEYVVYEPLYGNNNKGWINK